VHKLDEQVEDVLKHFGIKGMKWDIRRTPEQIAADGKDGSGGGASDVDEESDEDFGDKMDEMIDALQSKMGDIKDSIKKKGMKFLTGIFGKSETKYKLAKPNSKHSKVMGKAMKEAKAKNKNREFAEDFLKKRNEKGKRILAKRDAAITKSLESQGYVKQKKVKTNIKDKYKFRVESGK